jgi:hypothetical protein
MVRSQTDGRLQRVVLPDGYPTLGTVQKAALGKIRKTLASLFLFLSGGTMKNLGKWKRQWQRKGKGKNKEKNKNKP